MQLVCYNKLRPLFLPLRPCSLSLCAPHGELSGAPFRDFHARPVPLLPFALARRSSRAKVKLR
jgi:hypothetical protein